MKVWNKDAIRSTSQFVSISFFRNVIISSSFFLNICAIPCKKNLDNTRFSSQIRRISAKECFSPLKAWLNRGCDFLSKPIAVHISLCDS